MKLRSLLVTIGLLIAVAILLLQRSQISKLTADLQAAREQLEQPAASETSVSNTRAETNEIPKLEAENARMRTVLASARKTSDSADESEPPATEERRQAIARLTDSKTYVLALMMHAEDNQQRFATNLDQVVSYLSKGERSVTGTNIFDVVFQGSRDSVTNSSAIILVREHQAHQSSDGRWTKAYGFLDGHAEIHLEPTANFDAFEQQHSWPPPGQ